MPKLTIDNKPVTVEDGATILDAARKLGVEIPTLCFLKDYAPPSSCFVCVVRVNGNPRLVPSCATVATEGMSVESDTEEVHAARRTALELLLSDHLGDCVGPCQSVCPANMNIPQMIRQIAAGQYREAIITVKQHIALPAVLGRICPEICENGCRRKQQDASVSICKLKRFAADTDLASGTPYLPSCKAPSGKTVAIVGAGPAGLAAAYYLQQEGHACAILDDRDAPGGMLRYGTPEAKLPRTVLDAEINTIIKLGASIRSGVRVGKDVSLEELRKQYDAVLLAVGEVTAETAASLGLQLAGKGLKVDRKTGQTSLADVFAAGSAVMPSKHAVRAAADGRSAALAISQYFAGESITGAERPFTVHIGKLEDCEVPRFMEGGISEEGRLTPAGDGFSHDEARREGLRCMHCDCLKVENCDLRRYADAYDANTAAYRGERRKFERELSHPEIVHEPGKCILCGRCVAIAARANEALGMAFIGRGFTSRVNVPFQESLKDGLQRVATECAEHCPTASLALRDDQPQAR